MDFWNIACYSFSCWESGYYPVDQRTILGSLISGHFDWNHPHLGSSSCFRYPLCHRDHSLQHTSGQQYCSGRPCRAAPAGRNKKRLCSCQSLKNFSCAVGNSRYPVYWFMVIRNSSLSCVLTNRSFMNSIASTEFMSAR